MRKITAQIKAAFDAGKSREIGNTRTDGTSVWLHGNKIVDRLPDGSVYATLAGWNTPTTRERVNGITGANFSQSKGQPFLNFTPIRVDSWYRVA